MAVTWPIRNSSDCGWPSVCCNEFHLSIPLQKSGSELIASGLFIYFCNKLTFPSSCWRCLVYSRLHVSSYLYRYSEEVTNISANMHPEIWIGRRGCQGYNSLASHSTGRVLFLKCPPHGTETGMDITSEKSLPPVGAILNEINNNGCSLLCGGCCLIILIWYKLSSIGIVSSKDRMVD